MTDWVIFGGFLLVIVVWAAVSYYVTAYEEWWK